VQERQYTIVIPGRDEVASPESIKQQPGREMDSGLDALRRPGMTGGS
jgi:hypothetical protein